LGARPPSGSTIDLTSCGWNTSAPFLDPSLSTASASGAYGKYKDSKKKLAGVFVEGRMVVEEISTGGRVENWVKGYATYNLLQP
jgi:hypothetical protein